MKKNQKIKKSIFVIVMLCISLCFMLSCKTIEKITDPVDSDIEIIALSVDNIPYLPAVQDTSICQPVKVKKIGGDVVKCVGGCIVKTEKCLLQKRKLGSTQRWTYVPESMEVADKKFEYRCRCK